jgi:DNA-binding MarR family transcriptional regulator
MKDAINNQALSPLLMQIMFQSKHRAFQIAEKHELTFMQLSVLTKLSEDEPLAMNVLSHYFMCDASNITGIADRLESRGLTERLDHPSDRRIKMISLTSKGLALRNTIMTETIEAETAVMEPSLSSEERLLLVELLQKIVSAQSRA